jgi:hypothetical protein
MLFAATVEIGRLMFMAQVSQQAAGFAAEAIANAVDLDPSAESVYLESNLRIDITNQPANQSLYTWLEGPQSPVQLKPVDRLLLPAMVIRNDPGSGKRWLEYPGMNDQYDVPVLNGDGSLQYVPVLEWSVETLAGNRRYVSVQINYPFQSAAMVAYDNSGQTPGAPPEPNVGSPLLADDVGETGPYAGPDKLGRLYAHGTTVRPFRRLLRLSAAAWVPDQPAP